MRTKNKLSLPKKENLSDHRYKRIDMAAKCKIFVTHLTLDRHLQKEIWLPNMEYLIDHRCEKINMAVKYKIFVSVTDYFIGISIAYNMCTISNFFDFNWREQNGCQCQIFGCHLIFIVICKNKYDCQTKTTEMLIDVNEQIQLSN